MPLYEFTDDIGNRHRRDVEDLSQLPEGVTVTGRVFGALADGSGGFVTDGSTFEALMALLPAKDAPAAQEAPPAPVARPEAQYPSDPETA